MGAPVGVGARVVGDGAAVAVGSWVGVSVGVKVGGCTAIVGVASDCWVDRCAGKAGLVDLGVAVWAAQPPLSRLARVKKTTAVRVRQPMEELLNSTFNS